MERLPNVQQSDSNDPGDQWIREYANERNAIVVACDYDFADVTMVRNRICNHSGALVIQIRPQTARKVVSPLRKLLGSGHLDKLEHAICELYEDKAILTTVDGRFQLTGSRFRELTCLDN